MKFIAGSCLLTCTKCLRASHLGKIESISLNNGSSASNFRRTLSLSEFWERELMSGQGQKPTDLLSRSLNARVLVKLKGGRELRGKLKGFDAHMNLILGEAEEIIDKNSEPKQIGTVIVRGDNVIMLSPAVKSQSD